MSIAITGYVYYNRTEISNLILIKFMNVYFWMYYMCIYIYICIKDKIIRFLPHKLRIMLNKTFFFNQSIMWKCLVKQLKKDSFNKCKICILSKNYYMTLLKAFNILRPILGYKSPCSSLLDDSHTKCIASNNTSDFSRMLALWPR